MIYSNNYATIFVPQTRNPTAMPEFIRMVGMHLFFFANEHLPVHIHVQNADGRAKFNISPVVKLVMNKGLKASDFKLAKAVIKENKAIIIKAWEVFHGKTE